MTVEKRTRSRWPARLPAAALALSLALARPGAAGPCDPYDEEDWVFDTLLLVVDDEGFPDQREAVDALLAEFPELSLPEPERWIPELRAWLLHVENPTQALVDAIDDYRLPDGRRPADKAEFHWRFQTPEGGQRNLPDLTRTITIDDFFDQSAAGIIRAQRDGRRWSGAGVTVAVIDTAATLDHAVTADAVLGSGLDAIDGAGTAQVSANGLDDDGDGDVDESVEHGTFVGGLVHLAAPGARLLHVRVLDDDGHGDAWHVAQGIVDAVNAGADVLNLSLGVTNKMRILEEAVDWAIAKRGVVVVAAAGNRASTCVDRPANAAIEHPLVAVAAVGDDLQPAAFTNHGPEVSLSAPGVAVTSTFGDGFGEWSGTSFSTPLVAGGAAVLLEKYPELSPLQVRAALQATSQPFSDPAPTDMGDGVLDLGLVQSYEGPHRDSLRLRESAVGELVSWSPVAGASSYDLLRGEIRNLRRLGGSVDLGPMTCLRNDHPLAPQDELLADADPVPAGGFFYLLRDDAPDGGSTGSSSLGEPRIPAGTACP